MTEPDRARRDLEAWRQSLPADPYEVDDELRALNRRYLAGDRLEGLEAVASGFGRQVTAIVGPAALRYEQHVHLPELVRYDGLGHRVEKVRFDPAYHGAGAAIWGSGLVADSGTPGRAFEQATLL